MLTILIWLGSGFAFTVGFGVGVFVVKWVYKKDKSQIDGEQEARRLLSERNKIGLTQVTTLDRIADLIEFMTKKNAASNLAMACQDIINNVHIPDRQCSCHICPPCSDCIEYGALRQAVDDAKQAMKSIKL